MKANGATTKSQALDLRNLRKARPTMATTITINPMAEESLPTPKNKYMKVSGRMVLKREKGFGRARMARPIWENGKMVSHKVMEFLLLKTVTDTRDSIKML